MITIRQARATDSVGIGAVHVASWRSAYAGFLPEPVLTGLSAPRQAGYYDRIIRTGGIVHVAIASGPDIQGAESPANGAAIVGFVTARRRSTCHTEGEIETLYVLDDYRERGLGSQLMRAAATRLVAKSCTALLVWVLSDNPARWFYVRLGGRHAADGSVIVGGVKVAQIAYRWEPIDALLD